MKTKRMQDAYLIVRTNHPPLRKHFWEGVMKDRSDDAYMNYVEWYERDELKRMEIEIRRHVDDAGVEQHVIMQDTCEWCGAIWTEGESEHNGGCCDQDIEVMERCEAGEGL
jgi:hypothetical protein